VTLTQTQTTVTIEHLLASPLHRYEGRPRDGALPADGPELHDRIELREGLDIVGDRYAPTCTVMPWYPSAPSGATGTYCSVWVKPVVSVARTSIACTPSSACHSSIH
jgi:hypothetical protein